MNGPLPPLQPLDLRSARTRMWIAVAVGGIAGLVMPATYTVGTRLLCGWIACGVTLLALVGWIIVRTDPVKTRCRAAAIDPGRTAVWVLVIGFSLVSLIATMVVLQRTHDLPGFEARLDLGCCVATVVVSWLLTHVAFTLRYAHLYYRDDKDGVGGLEFPGGEAPDDLDFAYFAFTIGMCFQVSDVTIQTRTIRRTVLAHAMLAFAFNTFIVALAINLVFGQLT